MKVLNAVASSDGVGVSGRVTYGVPVCAYGAKMGIQWGSNLSCLFYVLHRVRMIHGERCE